MGHVRYYTKCCLRCLATAVREISTRLRIETACSSKWTASVPLNSALELLSNLRNCPNTPNHKLWAPTTLPTTLYRLVKKAYHSLRTVLYWSSRSCHSGIQSSGLRLDVARAREGSLPA